MTINPQYPQEWEAVIGIETHVQLATRSKLFSQSSAQFGAATNTQANALDLALPGTLPCLNRIAVDYAIKLGLALDAEIAELSVFARKNYFYPDLPKGYQISQFELPIIRGGFLNIEVKPKDDSAVYTKTVHLARAHLEEDAGKSLHDAYPDMTAVDLNRAGIALLEIVSEPEINLAIEAVAYCQKLHHLVRWLRISDGNMEEGSFRCDANVSLKTKGSKTLGTRCEVKNLNSFRFLEAAIDYEIARQTEILNAGGQVQQETRLYDQQKGITRSMRSKEDANDYRYFPDPDLLPLTISAAWVADVATTMPVLPAALKEKWEKNFNLSHAQTEALLQSRAMADFFEETVRYTGPDLAPSVANWMISDLTALLPQGNFEKIAISAAQFALVLQRIEDQTISGKIAKQILNLIWQQSSDDPGIIDRLIEEHGWQQISNQQELEQQIELVLAQQQKLVVEFNQGKTKALNALIGHIMKTTNNKANPQTVQRLLHKKLSI